MPRISASRLYRLVSRVSATEGPDEFAKICDQGVTQVFAHLGFKKPDDRWGGVV